ncbi:MAG: response regulator [Methylacidiphilales bacterium]|nr:response regulator [Candidatus Methylacidiphilales bacterium]
MNLPLKILFLEDSPADCELVAQRLAKDGVSCDIQRVETQPEFQSGLSGAKFDLIFADCTLPAFSGQEALRMARLWAPQIPFIFVSGTIGEETAIEYLHNGATDYVLKHRLSRLTPAVLRAIAEVEKRTQLELVEERLQQAQRMEAIGTLAGGIAHDFNNILTIIIGHAHLLKEFSGNQERADEIAVIIHNAANRGADLIRQMLAFARKSPGRQKATNLNYRIQLTVKMLKEAFPSNIKFNLHLDEALPSVLADPAQIDRILVNLASNARDAMPQGGTLTLETSHADDIPLPPDLDMSSEQSYIRLKITDTGSGMDQAVLPHVFEPFFTTKAPGKGTGLGLPVVYGLMQSNNGTIRIESEPGKGTTVVLYFPTAKKREPQQQPKTLIVQDKQHTETLLIVEDEPVILRFQKIAFESQGYHVLLAGDDEEAIRFFKGKRNKIDLVFTDIGLPKLDGLTLCSVLKGIKPDLKTLVASGYPETGFRKRMDEIGIDGFIAKPYQTNEMLNSVATILRRKKTQGLVS